MGALSPRTRNAQVALFQSGEVDLIVATDAIGMGLNLDIDHVAFAADRKFDGAGYRALTAAEMGQIAGRAGRHLRDGSFGSTGRCPPLDEDIIAALEEHRFDPVRLIQWRNPDLDYASFARLQQSLAVVPTVPGLVRARPADDERTFDILAARPSLAGYANSRAAVERLWDVCKLPDYRKLAPHVHADLIESLFHPLVRDGRIRADWFKKELAACDRTDGDIATLSQRIAEVRTFTYCANRSDWLDHPAHWQNVARALEDKLSDALHERLAQRFIDRRTSVLMRRLRENAMLEAEITELGDVLVENQHLGRLDGFRFTPDARAEGPEAKALKAAAAKALAGEIEARARRLAEADDAAFVLALDGILRWIGSPVARLQAGDKLYEPRLVLLADEHLYGASRDAVEQRLARWLTTHIDKLLGPLRPLEAGTGLNGAARGIGYQVAENLGVLERSKVADVVKGLDQTARGELRALGVRFGAHHLFTAGLMKPAPRTLAAQLFALKHEPEATGVAEVAHLASSGRTSIPVDPAISKDLYRVAGFRVCGGRAVRVDILERLADLIRPALAWRKDAGAPPPPGAYPGGGFVVTGSMTSLVGCAGEDFASILTALGYRMEMKPVQAIPVAVEGVAPIVVPEAAGDTETVEATPENAAEAPAEGAESGDAPADVAIDPTPDTAEEITAATDAAPAETAAAEPSLVAVWRPGRAEHDRPRHRPRIPREGRADRQRRNDAPRVEQAPQSAQPEQADDGRRGRRPEQSGDSRSRDDQPRSNRSRDDRPRDQRPVRTDRKEGDRPRDGDRRHGRDRGRPDRDKGRSGAEREQIWQDKPRVEKQLDPDSPFAKLLALKAAMEGKS